MKQLRGITSTRVVRPDGVAPATVLFEHGRISDIAAPQGPLDGVLDVGDLAVSPGLVDCHVHMNEPGRVEWEGFETATRAAAAGGVTSVIDMPLNSLPVTTTEDAFAQKLAASQGKRFVDVGFWGGVVPGNQHELPKLAHAGVLGCKAFLVHSGIDEFPNTTEADLRTAMPILRDLGLPLLAHAELELPNAPIPTDVRAYHGYLSSRPNAWEDRAIELLVRLCRETRCPVHIVHLSSASSLETLRRAKQEGLPITAETCPHYLCFAAEAIPDGATEYKCAPPIREQENRERLWQGLFDGVIDFIITDHSPCTPALKQPEQGDFMAAWGGIASLQLGLSAIWSEAHARGADLRSMARWMSEGPARFAGLASKKGRLMKGLDADLLVWNPEASFAVTPERLFFRHKVSPYLGRTLLGLPSSTLLRGQLVYDAGAAVVGEANISEATRAPFFPATALGQTLLHRS